MLLKEKETRFLNRRHAIKQKAIAIILASLFYPLPVLPAFSLLLSEPFDWTFIEGYFLAVLIGLILCSLTGVGLSNWLVRKNRVGLRYYLIAGTLAGTLLTTALFFGSALVSGGSPPMDAAEMKIYFILSILGGLSGFSLALCFWVFLRPDKEISPEDGVLPRRFGIWNIGAILAPLLCIFGLWSAAKYNDYRDKKIKEANRIWIETLPHPEFDTLTGPAPLTVKMTGHPFDEATSDRCADLLSLNLAFAKHPHKAPPLHYRVINWGEGPLEVYAEGREPRCLAALAHTYTKPGKYEIHSRKQERHPMVPVDSKVPPLVIEKTYTVIVTPAVN